MKIRKWVVYYSFKWVRISNALGFCLGFMKLGLIQGHAAVATCRRFGSGRDNFIGIRALGFFKIIFESFSKSSGYMKIYLAIAKLGNFYSRMLTIYFHCRMDPPPAWRERGRPRRGQVDEEAVSAPYNFLLSPELWVWPKSKAL